MLKKVTSESREQNTLSRLTAVRLSVISGFFLMTIILLLLINFYNLRQSDPLTSVNSQQLSALVSAHRLNPDDKSIKNEIQVLDQRIRQNYFNRQTIARTGSYLLIAGLCMFILSLKKTLVFSIVPSSGRQLRYNCSRLPHL